MSTELKVIVITLTSHLFAPYVYMYKLGRIDDILITYYKEKQSEQNKKEIVYNKK